MEVSGPSEGEASASAVAAAVAEDDYRVQAELCKESGNRAFKSGDFTEAIRCYTEALSIDPDNHTCLSNRSAAYLKTGDAKSKALHDAVRCIELMPSWAKGYSRKAAAEHALGRLQAACDTYREGLRVESENLGLRDGLAAAEAAVEAERKIRWARARAEEEAERERKVEEAKVREEESNLLDGFLGEIAEVDSANKSVKKDPNAITEKYRQQNLGTSEEQIARLLQKSYEWRNLNPFAVMQLDVDATLEDIKQRYRKLSTLVHPDKCLGVENARDAFEQVKTAYNVLKDEDQRMTKVRLIKNTRKRVAKERLIKLSKGLTEQELGPLEATQAKEVMKDFAKIEQRRRATRANETAQRRREQNQASAETSKLKQEFEWNKNWSGTVRRDKRVGNWRDFQTTGRKRAKVGSSWKAEESGASRVEDGNSHRRDWK